MKLLTLAAALILPGFAMADPYLGQCHMGGCIYLDQLVRHVVGEGSVAVPGELVMVSLRTATSDSSDTDPAALTWAAPTPAQFFCSDVRPAFRMEDGSYQALDLVTPVGATTLATAMYLRACHPEAAIGENPFAAAAELGHGTSTADVFADFEALTAR